MGMTASQYWDESPRLAVAYREAHKLRRELDNEQAWLHGLYVFDAFAVCLANAFAKRGAKRQMYLERPVDLFPPSEEEMARREREENKKMQEAMKAIARKQRQRKSKKGD